MLDIAAYSLPANVSLQAVVIVALVVFAGGYWIWGPGASPVEPGGVSPDFFNRTVPKRGARRIVELVTMLVLALGAIALAVATGPRLHDELSGHFSHIGENDTLFTLGLFGLGVALTFFAVREFFKLLRR